MPKVEIKNLIDGMMQQSDQRRFFFHLPTGSCVRIEDQTCQVIGLDGQVRAQIAAGGQEAMLQRIEQGEGEFVAIPDKAAVNEWQMMSDFIDTLADEEMKTLLREAIHRRGAFQHFKTLTNQHKLRTRWNAFRLAAYRQRAIEWCNQRSMEYIDLPQQPSRPARDTRSRCRPRT